MNAHLDYIILDRKELRKTVAVTTFDAANEILIQWRRSAAPGGEDVAFVVLWRDGGLYRGDFRLETEEHWPDLRAHIRRHLEFIGVFMESNARAEAEQRLA